MKKYLALLALIPLAGCGWFDRLEAYATSYSLVCVKNTGVMYVQFSSGAAPLYKADGSLVQCD